MIHTLQKYCKSTLFALQNTYFWLSDFS